MNGFCASPRWSSPASTTVSWVPQEAACTESLNSTVRSSICDMHSAISEPVSQAGPIGPRLTAAGNVALLIVPSSEMMSKQRMIPPADQGMSLARIGSMASIAPPRIPA